jgi:hypothetical protein
LPGLTRTTSTHLTASSAASGLKWMSVLPAQLGDDGFQVGGVLDGGGGDAHELAADGDELERLLHALGRVHGVAGEHGLHHDGVETAHDEAAAGGVADDDFAGETPLVDVG